jgi:hypothetical protein
LAGARLGGWGSASVHQRQAKDLGETMVIAHAVVVAESGQDVTVLIDDGAGVRSAPRRSDASAGFGDQGRAVGTMYLAGTPRS